MIALCAISKALVVSGFVVICNTWLHTHCTEVDPEQLYIIVLVDVCESSFVCSVFSSVFTLMHAGFSSVVFTYPQYMWRP